MAATATSREQLIQAISELGWISEAKLELEAAEADSKGVGFIRHLTDTGALTPRQAVEATCRAGGVMYIDLADVYVDPQIAAMVPADVARRETILPLYLNEHGQLLVAVPPSQAGNLILLDDLKRITARDVELVVSMKSDITTQNNKYYRSEGELTQLSSSVGDPEVVDDIATLTEVVEEAPIVRFVNLIITQAMTDGASDIHIEPTEKDLRIRFRIDGVLKEITRQPRSIAPSMISRIKIMSEMDIAEKRVPQDGRLAAALDNGHRADLRVATLPTVYGYEKIVMRILDNSTAQRTLDDLGFSPGNFTKFERSYLKTEGLILVTGPTGHGKSTTLYAAVNAVSTPQVNIITVEDPVEYRLAGINQVQVNKKAGLTFDAALRSILRMDPDIVLIGEMRDRETAHIGMEAALTGHLVFSTLHTKDAASAITRLVEMGVEPFLVGTALDVVLAQRLCRQLCVKCKIEYTPDPAELLSLPRFPWEDGADIPVLFRANEDGCNNCSGTGYKGRTALHEVMPVTEEIERLTVRGAASEEIGQLAIEQGMQLLVEDGWAKVGNGTTSIKEVLRVVNN